MNVNVNKTVPITFAMVVSAYQRVRKGGKAAGIDGESWGEFDKNPEKNLYVIWNRLASGSYHPSAVKEVEIPKKDGRIRKLGIPTLRDRIAQSVVKEYMEKKVDQRFHENSYGYRPLKSSKDAIEQVRVNCKERSWVIDVDIKSFFDEIDHELLMKAVEAMVEEGWVRMYVKRWLEMKIEDKEGHQRERGGKGTPQGGVISPLLANMFLHYALDRWLEVHYEDVKFVRYADDIVIHCQSKERAQEVMRGIRTRMQEVKLELNEKKTKLVYCKDYRRKDEYEAVQFDFLGFSYQPRASKSKYGEGKNYTAFTAEISKSNQKKINEQIKESINWRNTRMEIVEISEMLNSKLRGWINYFGVYGKRKLRRTLQRVDYRLMRWLKAKYKFNTLGKAYVELKRIKKANPVMFYHWQKGYC